jgi:Domain of unknown function (DUF4384)
MRTVFLLGTLALGLSACTISVRPNLALDYTRSNLITSLRPDRGEGSSYAVGENVRLSVTTQSAGYLTLVALDPAGVGSVIVQNARIAAGTTTFPRAQDGASFTVAPPRGLQRVRAIFTRTQPTTSFAFEGSYDAGRWNSATNSYTQGYAVGDRDVQETYFYIR